VFQVRQLPFASLQNLKEAIKDKLNRWKEITLLRQFENPLRMEQEAQLLQRGRAMSLVVEYFG